MPTRPTGYDLYSVALSANRMTKDPRSLNPEAIIYRKPTA